MVWAVPTARARARSAVAGRPSALWRGFPWRIAFLAWAGLLGLVGAVTLGATAGSLGAVLIGLAFLAGGFALAFLGLRPFRRHRGERAGSHRTTAREPAPPRPLPAARSTGPTGNAAPAPGAPRARRERPVARPAASALSPGPSRREDRNPAPAASAVWGPRPLSAGMLPVPVPPARGLGASAISASSLASWSPEGAGAPIGRDPAGPGSLPSLTPDPAPSEARREGREIEGTSPGCAECGRPFRAWGQGAACPGCGRDLCSACTTRFERAARDIPCYHALGPWSDPGLGAAA